MGSKSADRRQLQRHRESFGNLARDGTIREGELAQIAGDGAAEPNRVLDKQGLVQRLFPFERRGLFLVVLRVRVPQSGHRIAGNHPNEEKRSERDAQEAVGARPRTDGQG